MAPELLDERSSRTVRAQGTIVLVDGLGGERDHTECVDRNLGSGTLGSETRAGGKVL